MAFFNDFKEKFTNAAHSVSNKTKDSLELTRISGEIRTMEDKVSSLYTELGRNYFNNAGKEACDALCSRIAELREKIGEMDQRRMQLRNQNRCPACGAVMNEGARFCSNCGRRMPEPEAAAEPAPDAENTQFCPECGAMRRDDASFCDICGHDFNGQESPEEKKQTVITRDIEISVEEPAGESPSDLDAE